MLLEILGLKFLTSNIREMIMTYPLSPEEFQTTLAQDAEQRYHHFFTAGCAAQ